MLTYVYVFSEKYLSDIEIHFISDCKELGDLHLQEV